MCRQIRGEIVNRSSFLPDLSDRAPLVDVVEQVNDPVNIVSAENDVDPSGSLHDEIAVLLRRATTDNDLHTRVLNFDRTERTEKPVQLVVRILPNRACVEHNNVGILEPFSLDHAIGGEQSADPFRIVLVHLTAKRAHVVGQPATGRLAGNADAGHP